MSIDLEDPPQGRAEAEFAAELARIRPGLAAAYAEALPGARSTVLGLLWRGLLYEPVPGVAGRESAHGRIRLSDGRLLTGPCRLPYDVGAGEDSSVLLDGRVCRVWWTGIRTIRAAVTGPACRWRSSWRTCPSTGPWSIWT